MPFRLEDLKITAIAGVDEPDNEPAEILLFKRRQAAATTDDDLRKADRELLEKVVPGGITGAQSRRQRTLAAVADLARKLKQAGLPEDVVVRLLRESFPDLQGVFAGLGKNLANELRNKQTRLTKLYGGEIQRFDLSSELGRHELAKEVAKEWYPQDDETNAVARWYDENPDAHYWVNAAPRREPAQVKEAPVKKSWSAMNVGERAAEKWDELVQKFREDQPDLSYDQAVVEFAKTQEARDLWVFMTEPRRGLSFDKFVRVTERDQVEGDGSRSIKVKKLLGRM